MKKITLLLLLVSISAVDLSYSQVISERAENADQLRKIPQEEIFLHLNNPLLFVGEYLYYKLYCFNPAGDELSTISKVGYVELVGSDEQIIFRHKVRLENGTGTGDFFIPTGIPSGNYKLVGYTSWTTNKQEKPFYSEDLVIINPYRGNREGITSLENNKNRIDSLFHEDLEAEQTQKNSNLLKLGTDAQVYEKRALVELSLSGENIEDISGNYSLSVRRKDPLEKVFRNIIPSEDNLVKNVGNMRDRDSIYLPELRGEILSGRIVPTAGENMDLEGHRVTVSIPGENFIVKVSETDEEGAFHFNLDKEFQGETALLEVLGTNEEEFRILPDSRPSIDYSALEFHQIPLAPEMEELILKRSVYNQIENGYYSVKPDTILENRAEKPFFGDRIETYDLDKYTRFNTMKETFVEIIRFARILSNSQGENEFRIRGYHAADLFDSPPLLIVDGAVLQDQNKIIQYNPKKVKSIGIIRDRYFYGPAIFNGIINIETIDGDFLPQLNDSSIKKLELLPYQAKKGYFRQDYSESLSEKETIPDYRLQLLWEPYLQLDSDEKTITFFTSDVAGKFEISLEGFTFEGQPVSIRKEFVVK